MMRSARPCSLSVQLYPCTFLETMRAKRIDISIPSIGLSQKVTSERDSRKMYREGEYGRQGGRQGRRKDQTRREWSPSFLFLFVSFTFPYFFYTIFVCSLDFFTRKLLPPSELSFGQLIALTVYLSRLRLELAVWFVNTTMQLF
jgi:hypothetical protein